MKRALGLCLVLCLLPLAAVRADDVPVTVYYYERMPFFGEPGTDHEGIVLAVARMVLERAGIPFVFEKVPVNRIFKTLERPGPYCVPGAFRTPEREAAYLFSDAPLYQDSPPHVVVRSRDVGDFAGVRGIRDLLSGGKVLGVVESYSYGTWVDENIARYAPRRLVVTIGDNQANFYRMLLSSRFDYFFASLEEASSVMRSDEAFAAGLSVLPLADAPAGNVRWFMFSPGFPRELLARVNASIVAVRASDEYERLVLEAKRAASD